MTRKDILLILVLCLSTGVFGQSNDNKSFTVVFYNVENLFDTENNPEFEDDEYTPGGSKKWTEKRFQKKIGAISGVLMAIDKKNPPGIIGFCEVENRMILEQLGQLPDMEKGNYAVVHEDSPDRRGMDVALMYRKDVFELTAYKSLHVDFPRDTSTTRDILYVKLKAPGNEFLHFFVNHWKSRSEGQQVTENKRAWSAIVLRKAVDSILNFEPEARIIIMGDFNDEPTNMSLNTLLQANNKRKNASPRDLYNLYYDRHNTEDRGTYHYKGNWNMLDQIIISQALLQEPGYHTGYDAGKILKEDFMLYENPKANASIPNKTYGGDTYFGGISDHLPVYVVFELKE